MILIAGTAHVITKYLPQRKKGHEDSGYIPR
jgi:hypothetical protein